MPEVYTIKHTLLSSAVRTTNGSSNVINASEYDSCIFFINVTAIAGVGAKLSGPLQFSPDNETWYDSPHWITDMSAVSKQMIIVPALGKYTRFAYEIVGTVTFSIIGAFKAL